MNGKPFWKSKTFWFNAAAVANIAAPAIGLPSIPMDNDTAAVVMATGNVILRSITKGKITLISNKEE